MNTIINGKAQCQCIRATVSSYRYVIIKTAYSIRITITGCPGIAVTGGYINCIMNTIINSEVQCQCIRATVNTYGDVIIKTTYSIGITITRCPGITVTGGHINCIMNTIINSKVQCQRIRATVNTYGDVIIKTTYSIGITITRCPGITVTGGHINCIMNTIINSKVQCQCIRATVSSYGYVIIKPAYGISIAITGCPGIAVAGGYINCIMNTIINNKVQCQCIRATVNTYGYVIIKTT